MVYRHMCEISSLVYYRQHQNQLPQYPSSTHSNSTSSKHAVDIQFADVRTLNQILLSL